MTTTTLPPTTVLSKNILTAASLLRAGEVVAVPTETVYGLAANALDAAAVMKIFVAKQRPHFDPLIVHAADASAALKLASDVPEWARLLAENFWPGPLTLVLPKSDVIPELVTSGYPTVALRVPRHSMLHELLSQLDFPLAAPSANPFGYVSPTSAEHVLAQLDGVIPFILDGGRAQIGLESTIIGEYDGAPVVLRYGGTPIENIEAVIGKCPTAPADLKNAPGRLTSHYAPQIEVTFDEKRITDPEHTAAIRFRSLRRDIPQENQIVLSEQANLPEAARNLFHALRAFEDQNIKTIIVERVPAMGLGRAINDRLERAAARR